LSNPSQDELIRLTKLRARGVPFSKVIELTTGKKVIPVKPNDSLVDEVEKACAAVIERTNLLGMSTLASRIDEVSNKLEIFLAEELRKLKVNASNMGFSGYPDIEVREPGRTTYLEVKLTGHTQLTSSFRSFYYQPAENESKKIAVDAGHVLVSFTHDGKRLLGAKIVDLSKINVTLKSEWNTNNRELYSKTTVIREVSPNKS
jgi:hypothetical protein